MRACRKRKPKLSQTILSAQAGLPSNAIGDLERGERTIKAQELKNICKALEIPIKVFLAEVNNAQLRALGEPETTSSSQLGRSETAQEPDLFYFGVAVARSGGDLGSMVKTLHRMIKEQGPKEEG